MQFEVISAVQRTSQAKLLPIAIQTADSFMFASLLFRDLVSSKLDEEARQLQLRPQPLQ